MRMKPNAAWGRTGLRSSPLIYGCMRVADPAKARAAVLAAWEAGYRHFDHADIYGRGACEQVFGDLLRQTPSLRREEMLLTSKVGIRFAGDPNPNSPKRYDFSADWIRRSCEGSLRRLGVETLDCYLLHRPDVLMDPGEVAAVFQELHRAGKVRTFGVSNFTPAQVEALRAALPFPLACHQIELHPARLAPFTDGTLTQCQALGMTPTAWSPVHRGLFGEGGAVPENHPRRDELRALTAAMDEIAAGLGATRATLTLAWLMAHPAGVQPIVGSTDPRRIAEAARALDVRMDRETWYRIYALAGGPLP